MLQKARILTLALHLLIVFIVRNNFASQHRENNYSGIHDSDSVALS